MVELDDLIVNVDESFDYKCCSNEFDRNCFLSYLLDNLFLFGFDYFAFGEIYRSFHPVFSSFSILNIFMFKVRSHYSYGLKCLAFR